MKKVTLFFAACLFAVSAMAEGKYVAHSKAEGHYYPNSISENKKYIVGSAGEGVTWLWELETGKFRYISDAGNQDVETINSNENNAAGVSNDGVVAGTINGVPAYYRNGKWTSLLEKAEYGSACAITPDGSKIIGMVSDQNYRTTPLVWSFDAETDSYILSDTLEFTHPEFQLSEGSQPTDISDDGKTIVGFAAEEADWMGCVWKYNEETKNYDFDLYSKRIIDNLTETIFASFCYDRARVSANGEWLVADRTEIQVDPDDYFSLKYAPVRYSIKDDSYEILDAPENLSENAVVCSEVANDGTVVLFTEGGGAMTERKGYVVPAGKDRKQPAAEYFTENGVTNMPEGFSDLIHTLFLISSDARIYVGNFMDNGNFIPYAVDLDGTIASDIEEVETALDKVEIDNNFCTVVDNELFFNDEVSNLRIFAINAQTVYSLPIVPSTLNLSNLNPGIYVVVADKAGRTVSTKVAVH